MKKLILFAQQILPKKRRQDFDSYQQNRKSVGYQNPLTQGLQIFIGENNRSDIKYKENLKFTLIETRFVIHLRNEKKNVNLAVNLEY